MDVGSLFSMETMSAAMTNAPKSIPVLSGIVKLATDIRETTERVDINKQQCQRLSQRIDTLIGFLAERDFSECLTDSMHLALNRFETFLQECLEFIETFLETTWFKRIVNNKDHEKKFLDLNRELTQYSNDLNFGIGLSNIQTIKKHPKDNAAAPPPPPAPVQVREHVQEFSPRSNSDDFNKETPPDTESPVPENILFVSGIWEYHYQQCHQWFGPFQHRIDFDQMRKTLRGYGEDNVGNYVLKGSFSDVYGKIDMALQYQPGTGNPHLNFGHQDMLQLTWSPSKGLFEGIAYSQAGGSYTPSALIIMSRRSN